MTSPNIVLIATMQLAAYSKTWNCSAYLTIEGGKDMAMPGEDGTITARLIKPQVLEVGQTFTLRDAAHTVGTGKVRFDDNNQNWGQ